jgi:DNA-binding GntR family transcriptional regulator
MSENLSQKAYSHIHDKLTSGTLRPGLRLSNRKVAQEIGVSFTPVREALNRLVSEGLLEYRDGVGVFVPEATRREIEELYDVREMLECAVVARECGRLSQRTLQELRDLHGEMCRIVESVEEAGQMGEHGQRFRELDSAFHLTLIRGTGNRQLLDVVTDLRKKCAIKSGGASMADLVGHVFHAEPLENVRRTLREHGELLSLLEKSDGVAAAELMCRHIRTGRQLAVASIDRDYMSASRHAVHRRHSAEKEAASRGDE